MNHVFTDEERRQGHENYMARLAKVGTCKRGHPRISANRRKTSRGCRLCYNESMAALQCRKYKQVEPAPKTEQQKWERILTKAGLSMNQGRHVWLVYLEYIAWKVETRGLTYNVAYDGSQSQ